MYRFVLLNLKTYGMKSLDRQIELQFYNKNIEDLSYDKPLVKAIYGTNGEGKTAIAYTLELYKNSIISGDYLAAQSFNKSLKRLINQHTNGVYIDLYFAFIKDDGRKRIFHHVIHYILKDDRVLVAHEKISECKGNIWGNTANEILLLETDNGEITYLYKKSKYREEILAKAANLVSNSSSVFPIIVNTVELFGSENIDSENGGRAHFAFMTIILFAMSMNVFIDKDDQQYVSTDRIESTVSESNDLNLIPSFLSRISDGADEVDIDGFDLYKNEIEKIERLLKVFKDNLDHIEVDTSNLRNNKLICKKTLVYKNGDRVDLEYESTGIKKLVRLFSALSTVDKGGVVFIDEFDANIHDVYLCKLIEYFIDYTNGEFIFTTHNLGPMEVLDKKGLKHSIDFINRQGINSWSKNGNYSVVKVYRNGMIPNSPFNISSVDFVKVFSGGKNNA